MTRLSLPALAVLTALASPAMADPARDYARLREAMPTLLFGTDVALHVQVQTEVLKRLEGRWVAVSPLMADGVTFPDAEGLNTLCSKLTFEVAPNGALGLTMTMATTAEPYVIQWITSAERPTFPRLMRRASLPASSPARMPPRLTRCCSSRRSSDPRGRAMSA